MSILGDPRSKDQRRAAALGWLANPQATLDLFDQTADHLRHPPRNPTQDAQPTRPDPRPPATLYVHLTDTPTLETGSAPGLGWRRVEGIGPVTLNRLQSWLANSRVTVKPVIDLPHQTPVDAYEIPNRVREAIHLICPVDCFPYATYQPHRRPRPHHPLPATDRVAHPDKPGSGTSDR